MSQQEAVSRIKDNSEVIITVLRAHKKPTKPEDHIYEDILYSDIGKNQENSSHHGNTRERLQSTGKNMLRVQKSDPFQNKPHDTRHLSPTYGSDPPRRLLSEKVSADSGLSSSTSSFSPPHHSKDRASDRRFSDSAARHQHSYRAERDKRFEGRNSRASSTSEPSPLSRNIRIEGNYEVEVKPYK